MCLGEARSAREPGPGWPREAALPSLRHRNASRIGLQVGYLVYSVAPPIEKAPLSREASLVRSAKRGWPRLCTEVSKHQKGKC